MISNHVLTAEIFKSFTQVLNQITHFLKPQTSDLKVLCVTQILLLLIINKLYLLLRPGRGAEYCNNLSVCLSVCVCVYVCPRVYLWTGTTGPIVTKFLCRYPVVMAQCSSGGIAICYVLPMLWMTSFFGRNGPYSDACNTGAESDVYECLVVYVFSYFYPCNFCFYCVLF